MHRLLILAHSVRRRVLRALRWPTRGAKLLVRDADGGVLLVRNSYGRTDLWVLPGGGIGWRETPAAAAARELQEETGCSCPVLTPAGVFRARGEGRRDTVHLFTGVTHDAPVPDGFEVLEARFFPLDALPATTSDATLRRVAELHGAAATPYW